MPPPPILALSPHRTRRSDVPIADVTAGQAPHNDPSRALVCSADASGQVLVHALEADGSWQNCCAFDVTTYDETPSLCTSTRMRGVYLYCAYSTGHVRIFDLVSCSQLVQISAHARWIHALEVHPNGALFATASEDTTIALWDFHEGPKVRELPWLTRVTYRLATSPRLAISTESRALPLTNLSLSSRVSTGAPPRLDHRERCAAVWPLLLRRRRPLTRLRSRVRPGRHPFVEARLKRVCMRRACVAPAPRVGFYARGAP